MYEIDTTNDAMGDIVVLLKMTSGQQVSIRPNSVTTQMYGADRLGMYSWFSAYLIQAA